MGCGCAASVAPLPPDQVVCHITADDFIDAVYYNGDILSHKVQPSCLAGVDTIKTFRFTRIPGAVLAISFHDHQNAKGKTKAFYFMCESQFPSWNFALRPENAYGKVVASGLDGFNEEALIKDEAWKARLEETRDEVKAKAEATERANMMEARAKEESKAKAEARGFVENLDCPSCLLEDDKGRKWYENDFDDTSWEVPQDNGNLMHAYTECQPRTKRDSTSVGVWHKDLKYNFFRFIVEKETIEYTPVLEMTKMEPKGATPFGQMAPIEPKEATPVHVEEMTPMEFEEGTPVHVVEMNEIEPEESICSVTLLG